MHDQTRWEQVVHQHVWLWVCITNLILFHFNLCRVARLNRCVQLEPRANILFDRQTVATTDSFYFNAEVSKRSLSVWREKITCVVQSVQEPLPIILQPFGYIWSPGVCWAHSTCFFFTQRQNRKITPDSKSWVWIHLYSPASIFELWLCMVSVQACVGNF